MNDVTFLQDLAVVMIIAALVTLFCHRFKQPVVLGYIIAGVIIGPHTPPFPLIKDETTIKTLADLGIVFLMFSLGLEFSLRKLKKVGSTAFVASGMVILVMVWVGYALGRIFGWGTMDCVFLGAMLSVSSTTIIVKVLNELGRGKEKFAELIFGILIVEDVLAIVMIALLSGIAMTGTVETRSVLATVVRMSIFLVVVLVLGLLAVPRVLAYVARFKSNEMLLVTVLGLCFGVSLLAVKLGYSQALGAFLIGAVIAEAREVGRIEILTEPIRDMFSAVFFVAIGLMIDPVMLWNYAVPILIISVAVVIGQVSSCAFGTFVAGHDTRTSLRVGMGLAQIGEFSFIIAALGLKLNVTSEFLYPIAVAVSVVTTLLTPYLIRNSDRVVGWFDRVAPPRLVNYLEIYTRWIGQWRELENPTMMRRLLQRWSLQILLNLTLISGIFIAVAYVARQERPDWLPPLPGGQVIPNAILWFCAALLSLPVLIAIYRKLQAMAMLLGQAAGKKVKIGRRAAAVEVIVTNTIQIAGVIAIAQLLLLLSSTLLPVGKLMIFLVIIIAGVAALLWRGFINIYSKAQIALEGTFAQPPPPRHHEPPAPLAGLFKEAQILIVTAEAESPCKGLLIREIALRSQTGASIVAIQRGGETLINPGPDEEVTVGDQLLLIGSHAQLEMGRTLLCEGVLTDS